MIKALDAAQGGPPPESSGAELPAATATATVEPAPEDTPFLSVEEKRRILARIARVNPLDCFDESGAFDLDRARRILPPGAIRHIAVHETTRLDAEGQPVTQRRINVRLVDPVSALRLDDLLERQREPGASRSHSNSSTNTKTFSRKDFNLLTEKTMALDDANHSIEQLRKALAEMDDRELQLSKELEEKDHQLSQPLSPSNGSQPLSKVEGPHPTQTLSSSDQSPTSPPLPTPVQGDTGCQPVDSISQTPSSSSASSSSSSESLGAVEGQAWNAEKIARKRKPIEVRILEQEIEHRRNTSGIGGFNNWLRSKGLDPAKYPPPPFVPRPPAAKPQKATDIQPARPPP